MSDNFDLIQAIDRAAAKLLDIAGFGATIDDAKRDLPEQVKAFQAVVAWAEARSEIKPAEKGKTKFDGIREQFRETAKRRGRPAAEAESSPNAGAGESIPADPAPVAPASLFDE